jgi:hypothetical protein
MGMSYEYEKWDNEDKYKRDKHWDRLRKCNADYLSDNPTLDNLNSNNGLYYFLQKTYGIKIHFSDDGKIKGTFDIIDEKKYMLFLIKYSD